MMSTKTEKERIHRRRAELFDFSIIEDEENLDDSPEVTQLVD